MNQNSKFISLLLLLISFFIIVFFTSWVFYNLQWNLDTHWKSIKNLEDKKKELLKLNELKKSLAKGLDKEIEKYAVSFREDQLSAYIYWYIEDTNGQGWFIAVKDLNFIEGKINEYGFKEGQVEISVRVSDEATLLRFLSFLTSKESQYKFFIENFSYSDTWMWWFNITIPLKIFYK